MCSHVCELKPDLCFSSSSLKWISSTVLYAKRPKLLPEIRIGATLKLQNNLIENIQHLALFHKRCKQTEMVVMDYGSSTTIRKNKMAPTVIRYMGPYLLLLLARSCSESIFVRGSVLVSCLCPSTISPRNIYIFFSFYIIPFHFHRSTWPSVPSQ
ncbi:hypothetical protein VNO78_26615 [Psophocarpus tetragonolobus]|uniref:Uncharacterized protein n=1 Tax=Psophocarpus tetragonolobus TaxID=3891 RepID=A0AAN9RZJ8_PSOTE